MINSINFKTKLYAVIGDPISHSLSPVFQNYLIKKRNLNSLYIPLKITSENLEASIGFLKDNFNGFNVTIPHKESIIKYLDEIDPIAQKYGAVNTVKVFDNKLIGYNTDGFGFVKSLSNFDFKGKKVLLLGAGGAAKVIAFEVIALGSNLTIINRNLKRAKDIKDSIEKTCKVSINLTEKITNSFDIIINSTSVGMYPDIDDCPLELNSLNGAELVYDLIYNPFETKLLKYGNAIGAKTVNGLLMLIYQGIKSFEIWTDELILREDEELIYNLLKNEQIEK